jgi:GT2 family glycosyltransferase
MRAPELSAVVLSYENEDTVVGAVESLLGQRPPVEVVVSHSGGGRTPELLSRAHPSVRVVASEERRTPGAARNAGVAVTATPYVSFLAADCRALPGWSAARLRHHGDGAQAVASVLVPGDRGSVPLAAHLLQNSFRMGHVAASPMRRSGVSYSRDVLERHGPFPETFPFGEDIALNDRLIEAGVEIVPASDVVTAHRYPTSVRRLLADRYRRGRERAAVYRTPLRRSSVGVAGALLTPALALARAGARGSGLGYRELVAVTPLLVAGSIATAAGTVVGGGLPAPHSCPELVSLRRRTWTRRLLSGRAAA